MNQCLAYHHSPLSYLRIDLELSPVVSAVESNSYCY